MKQIIKGLWFLPDVGTKVAGVLTIDTKFQGEIVLETMGEQSLGGKGYNEIWKRKLENSANKAAFSILGETDQGKITLLDCIEKRVINKGSLIKQIFIPKYTVKGAHLDTSNPAFYSFDFECKNLANIIGLTRIMPKLNSSGLTEGVNVLEHSKQNPIVLLKNPDYQIQIKNSVKTDGIVYQQWMGRKNIVFSENFLLQIDFTKEQSIDQIVGWADKISKFISLSSLEYEQITSIKLGIKGIPNRCELISTEIGKDLFEIKNAKNYLKLNFYYGQEDGEYFVLGLKNWLEKYESNKHFLNQFFRVFFSETHFVESSLKDYVTVIEGYGQRNLEKSNKEYLTKEEFERKYAEPIKKFIEDELNFNDSNPDVSKKLSNLKESLIKFIHKANNHNPKLRSYFDRIIKDIRDSYFPLWVLLESKYDIKKIINEVIAYRNYFSHLNPEKEYMINDTYLQKARFLNAFLELLILTRLFKITDPNSKHAGKFFNRIDNKITKLHDKMSGVPEFEKVKKNEEPVEPQIK